MINNFQSPNLQRVIFRKKYNYFVLNFHQLIYSSSSISRPSLKFLAVIGFEISYLQNCTLSPCITRQGEIIQTRKKIRVSYFFMRNPYMKFQNPSLNSVLTGRTDERTNRRTNAQAETNMLPTFSKLGA